MSVVNHLIDSGLFEELSRQPSNDTVRLGVIGYRYATVYVPRGDREMEITLSALCQKRFPNNEKLLEFANCHATHVEHGKASNRAYVIGGQHVAEVVALVREGLGS